MTEEIIFSQLVNQDLNLLKIIFFFHIHICKKNIQYVIVIIFASNPKNELFLCLNLINKEFLNLILKVAYIHQSFEKLIIKLIS